MKWASAIETAFGATNVRWSAATSSSQIARTVSDVIWRSSTFIRGGYVVEDADGAGNSVVTIFVDDLDAHVAAIAARGLEPDERLTYSNGVRKALYRDPDGNDLGFGGAPLDTGS